MEIHYNISEKDVLNHEKKRASKYILFTPYIFIMIFVFSFCISFWNPEMTAKSLAYKRIISKVSDISFWFGVLIYCAFLSILIIAYRYRHFRKVKKVIRDNPTILGNRKLEILENKLISTSSVSRSEFSIYDIHKIEDEKELYSLYIKNDKDPTLIIPKKDQSVDSLIQYLTNKLIDHHSNKK